MSEELEVQNMDKIDILNREAFVNQLLQLVESISENKASVSFAIDGVWGCGKSFVLDMFEEQLEKIQSEKTATDKYLIVRYNCWKYDYYEEPVIAIVSTIIDTIDEKTRLLYGVQGEKIKGILKAVRTTLLSISTTALKTTTGINVDKAYSVVKSGIDTGKAEYEKMQNYDRYFDFKHTLHRLQNALNKLGEHYTLVFLVDELDRCLPEYAIRVLERLHHLTESTKGIISIIAIDKTQLQTSVCHIFGFSDAKEYLKKFLQFTIPLDVGKTSEKVIDKYSDYIALFDKSLFPMEDSIEEFWQTIFMNIGVREQEQLVDKAMMVHKLLYEDIKKDYSFMCIELLMIVLISRYQDTKVFSRWFKEFGGVTGDGRNMPPFSEFFVKEFEKIRYEDIIHVGQSRGREYKFLSSNSLYGAIVCIWYELFLKDSINDVRFSMSEVTLNDLLKNNAEELKKFFSIIKIIK